MFDTKQDYEEEVNFRLVYTDENGKQWKFSRLKKVRAYIREDGKRFSHSHLYMYYEYQGTVDGENPSLPWRKKMNPKG